MYSFIHILVSFQDQWNVKKDILRNVRNLVFFPLQWKFEELFGYQCSSKHLCLAFQTSSNVERKLFWL